MFKDSSHHVITSFLNPGCLYNVMYFYCDAALGNYTFVIVTVQYFVMLCIMYILALKCSFAVFYKHVDK